MCISTGNVDSFFFLRVTPFFNLEIWPKWKIHVLIKTVYQRNSSETAQQNFVQLCSNKGHKMRISTEILIQFFFLGITPFYNFKIWPKLKILLKQFVSITPLKLIKRISWNFVVMKDIMCRCAYPHEILIKFFSGSNAPFLNLEIWPKLKILLKTVRQHNLLKPLNRILWKLCSYEGQNQ